MKRRPKEKTAGPASARQRQFRLRATEGTGITVCAPLSPEATAALRRGQAAGLTQRAALEHALIKAFPLLD